MVYPALIPIIEGAGHMVSMLWQHVLEIKVGTAATGSLQSDLLGYTSGRLVEIPDWSNGQTVLSKHWDCTYGTRIVTDSGQT